MFRKYMYFCMLKSCKNNCFYICTCKICWTLHATRSTTYRPFPSLFLLQPLPSTFFPSSLHSPIVSPICKVAKNKCIYWAHLSGRKQTAVQLAHISKKKTRMLFKAHKYTHIHISSYLPLLYAQREMNTPESSSYIFPTSGFLWYIFFLKLSSIEKGAWRLREGELKRNYNFNQTHNINLTKKRENSHGKEKCWILIENTCLIMHDY